MVLFLLITSLLQTKVGTAEPLHAYSIHKPSFSGSSQ